jgi:heterodisulfide reductase subunit A-like polyferredoxin
MPNLLTINAETCKACGHCGEVCPIRIMGKDGCDTIRFRRDRLPLCIACG